MPERIRSARFRLVKSNAIGPHLVGIGGHRQVAAMAAIVGNTQPCLEAEITLDSEVPLLDIGILVVESIRVNELLRARLGDICRKRTGERVLCPSIRD